MNPCISSVLLVARCRFEFYGKQLVAARCRGGGREGWPRSAGLSLGRCCRCTASPSPRTRHRGSKTQTIVRFALPARPCSTVRIEGNSTATRPGINQAGRRSAAQVTMPPLSLSQRACHALSALLPLRSAASDFLNPVCLAQNVSMPCQRVKVKCHPPTRSPHTHLPCL